MRHWPFRFVLTLTVSSLGLLAQTSVTSASAQTDRAGAVSGVMHLTPRQFFGRPFTGAPYSAQRVTESVQIGSDGTRFTTNFQQETVYRDSQGRTRTERPMMPGPRNRNAFDSPILVEISDPVAGIGYTLDTQHKVAHRYTVESAPVRPRVSANRAGSAAVSSGSGVTGGISGEFSTSVAPPGSAGGGGGGRGIIGSPGVMSMQSVDAPPLPTHEDLGLQTIEGVLAKGSRQVTTWPVGSQGNDRPFQSTNENWYSEELGLMILNKSADPRQGEHTTRLINISRAEPAASLFAPPPDYSVVDEAGPFTIEWTGPARPPQN